MNFMFANVLLLCSVTFSLIEAFGTDELEDYFYDGPIEYGPVDYWVPAGPPDFFLKSAICNQCPQKLRPPKPCVRCSADNECGSNKMCCPFITLSTAAKACNSEQRNNCRLTKEIQVDFLRKACSCVRQIKCCVSAITLPAVQTSANSITTTSTTSYNDSPTTTTPKTKTATTTKTRTVTTTKNPTSTTVALTTEVPTTASKTAITATPSITVKASEFPEVTTSPTTETSANETTT